MICGVLPAGRQEPLEWEGVPQTEKALWQSVRRSSIDDMIDHNDLALHRTRALVHVHERREWTRWAAGLRGALLHTPATSSRARGAAISSGAARIARGPVSDGSLKPAAHVEMDGVILSEAAIRAAPLHVWALEQAICQLRWPWWSIDFVMAEFTEFMDYDRVYSTNSLGTESGEGTDARPEALQLKAKVVATWPAMADGGIQNACELCDQIALVLWGVKLMMHPDCALLLPKQVAAGLLTKPCGSKMPVRSPSLL